MHTRVRLVIFGTFLFISLVLNERVRTNLFFLIYGCLLHTPINDTGFHVK